MALQVSTPESVAKAAFTRELNDVLYFQDAAMSQLAEHILHARQRQPTSAPRVLLFAGPPSVGKTTAARYMADLLNAVDGKIPPLHKLQSSVDRPYYKEVLTNTFSSGSQVQIPRAIADFYATLASLGPDLRSFDAAAHLREVEATLSLGPLFLPSKPHRKAVLLLDECDRVKSMWDKLMQFFTDGVISVNGTTVGIPRGWDLVVLLATNVGEKWLLHPITESEQAVLDHVRSEFKKVALKNQQSHASRTLNHIILFRQPTSVEQEKLARQCLFQLLAQFKRRFTGHSFLADDTFIRYCLGQLATASSTDTRSMSTVFLGCVQRAISDLVISEGESGTIYLAAPTSSSTGVFEPRGIRMPVASPSGIPQALYRGEDLVLQFIQYYCDNCAAAAHCRIICSAQLLDELLHCSENASIVYHIESVYKAVHKALEQQQRKWKQHVSRGWVKPAGPVEVFWLERHPRGRGYICRLSQGLVEPSTWLDSVQYCEIEISQQTYPVVHSYVKRELIVAQNLQDRMCLLVNQHQAELQAYQQEAAAAGCTLELITGSESSNVSPPAVGLSSDLQAGIVQPSTEALSTPASSAAAAASIVMTEEGTLNASARSQVSLLQQQLEFASLQSVVPLSQQQEFVEYLHEDNEEYWESAEGFEVGVPQSTATLFPVMWNELVTYGASVLTLTAAEDPPSTDAPAPATAPATDRSFVPDFDVVHEAAGALVARMLAARAASTVMEASVDSPDQSSCSSAPSKKRVAEAEDDAEQEPRAHKKQMTQSAAASGTSIALASSPASPPSMLIHDAGAGMHSSHICIQSSSPSSSIAATPTGSSAPAAAWAASTVMEASVDSPDQSSCSSAPSKKRVAEAEDDAEQEPRAHKKQMTQSAAASGTSIALASRPASPPSIYDAGAGMHSSHICIQSSSPSTDSSAALSSSANDEPTYLPLLLDLLQSVFPQALIDSSKFKKLKDKLTYRRRQGVLEQGAMSDRPREVYAQFPAFTQQLLRSHPTCFRMDLLRDVLFKE